MKTKISFLISFTVLFFKICIFSTYAQTWLWSTVIHDSEVQTQIEIKQCIDENKNVYIASYYRNMTYPASLPCPAPSDLDNIFIAKYDSAGAFVWIKSFGGNNPYPSAPNWIGYSERPYSMTIDTINHCIYASGRFYDSAQFGNTTLTSYTPGTICEFVMKMDYNGNVEWAKKMINFKSFSMSTDQNGFLYMKGGTQYTTMFDNIAIATNCYFISKIKANGDHVWTKKITESGDFNPANIIVSNNHIFVNGYSLNDTITMGTVVKYVPAGTKWSVLGCLDMDGNAQWLSLYAGTNSECGAKFSVDPAAGSIYTTGYFTGEGYFGDDTLSSQPGEQHMFLAKHDSTGQLVWAKQIHSNITSRGYCISSIVDSILYVSGWFSGKAFFNDTLTAESSQDMFVARYNLDGECITARNFGKAVGVCVDQDNNHAAYVSGIYSSNITIGAEYYTIDGMGDREHYLAKLSSDIEIGRASCRERV